MGAIKGVKRGKYKIKQQIDFNHEPSRLYCELCNKCYKRKVILKHHILTNHLKYRGNCPICTKTFVSTSVCNRHLKRRHGMTKPKLKFEFKTQESKAENGFEAGTTFESKDSMLTVNENEKFGRHLIASSDIEEGQEVITASVCRV